MQGGELFWVLKDGLEEVEVSADGGEDEADAPLALFQQKGLDGGVV